MKKLFLLVFCVMCSTISMLSAEFDVIIKTNSEKIEALIQEVSDTEVRYRKANNPNGPMFVIKTSDISSILYANGDVQAIAHETLNTEFQNIQKGHMLRVGNTYSIDGKILDSYQIKPFLSKNCIEAFDYYNKWDVTEKTGWSFLAIGPVLCLPVGLTMFAFGYRPGLGISGVVFMAVGAAMTVVSVPLIACGNVNKKQVNEVYNTYCSNKYNAFNNIELKLNASQNGLGLALCF